MSITAWIAVLVIIATIYCLINVNFQRFSTPYPEVA